MLLVKSNLARATILHRRLSLKLLAAMMILAHLAILGCATSSVSNISMRSVELPIGAIEQSKDNIGASDTLNLVSINLAHGRKDSMNQWLVSSDKTRSNLDDIAAFLERTDADVVALQEADGPSAWSGRFDHVAYLAERAGFPYYIYAEHAQITMGNYGTAILSRWPIEEAIGVTFSASPPTANKGFTLAKIRWQNSETQGNVVLLDIVSVHLDFSRKSVRREQVDEMAQVITPRNNPLIIMGDFNSEWLARKYTIDSFADSSPMHVYDAANEDLSTYKDKRLDWILLSRELEFDSYRTEKEVLSDHSAIVAHIRMSTSGEVAFR